MQICRSLRRDKLRPEWIFFFQKTLGDGTRTGLAESRGEIVEFTFT